MNEFEERKIKEIIELALKNSPYWIYRLDIDPPTGNGWIRLRIDAEDPITIKDCEIVNRKIRAYMDLEGLSEIYNLEVSSPGAERDIELPKDAKRFFGRYVKLRIKKENGKTDYIIGKLGKLKDENTIEIIIPEKKGKKLTIDISQIEKANLYLKI